MQPFTTGLAGSIPGTRQMFSAAFFADLGEVWAAHGKEAMLHTARTQPATGFGQQIDSAAGRCRSTGKLARQSVASDWSDLRELLSAIQAALPDAADRAPGEIFRDALDALRNCPEIFGQLIFGED